MKPQIVNIVNFIRGVEPRDPGLDLVEPVRGQLKLMLRHRLRGTFLLQYDALMRRDIVELLLPRRGGPFEFGAWLEVVQPLAREAGIPWRGRYAWDWHTDVGFTVGYTPEEREKIVDALMEKFKGVFGCYPRSVGSWFLDSHTLSYLSSRYDVVASCNCKDQRGTDGYTLWGGYFNQAYYPSARNAFAPAQTAEGQIPLPVFRMLGSDPIYQYDTGMDGCFNPTDRQDVYTLEPVYPLCGGSPKWTEWFAREAFSPLTLSFGYAQAGQENSFGWGAMKDGLAFQFALFERMQREGSLSVQTLEETGRWFRAQYPVTPASSLIARSDWKDEGRQSFWYCSRFYRANFLWERGHLWVRDIQKFDEAYDERYLNHVCDSNDATYDNLPVMDGNRWSGGGVRAGIWPVGPSGQPLAGGEPDVEMPDDDTMIIRWPVAGGALEFICRPDRLEFRASGLEGWAMKFVAAPGAETSMRETEANSLRFCHNGYRYAIIAECGGFSTDGGAVLARPASGRICWRMAPAGE